MIQCGNNPTHTCGCGLGRPPTGLATNVQRLGLPTVAIRLWEVPRVGAL